MHQIRREKRKTVSKVIVCGKRNINWVLLFPRTTVNIYLTILKRKNVSLPLKVETDQFVICLVLPECLSVKICCFQPSDSEANRDGADAESPFPLFFSFSASFKNSNPRGKVGKLSSFWDWWAESLFIFIIVAKYIIFPRANNGCSRDKKKFLAKRYAHAISVHYRDFEHAYVYWIWLRGSASYVRISVMVRTGFFLTKVARATHRDWKFVVKLHEP